MQDRVLVVFMVGFAPQSVLSKFRCCSLGLESLGHVKHQALDTRKLKGEKKIPRKIPVPHSSIFSLPPVSSSNPVITMPTDFLTLPAELRQAILIETYDATARNIHSKVTTHIRAIKTWRKTLHKICPTTVIYPDIEYAHRTWLSDLEKTANKEWYILSPWERNDIFGATRGGCSPWSWVHGFLEGLGKPEIYDVEDHPYERRRWGKGPSPVTWDSWGYKHPPETWGCTDRAHDDGCDGECFKNGCFRLWDYAVDDVGYLRDVYEGARKRKLFSPCSPQRGFGRGLGTGVLNEVEVSDDTGEGWQLVMSRKARKSRNQVRAITESAKSGKVLI